MRPLIKTAVAGAIAAVGFSAMPAHASLSAFTSFTGQVAASTSGCGSTQQTCTLTAEVPAGSTVLGAYLYTSLFSASSAPTGDTFGGSAVTYATALGVNAAACCSLEAFRSDVTGLVKPVIDGGAGGTYSFTMHESLGNQDGEGLVVVYSNAALGQQSVGILDGWSSSSGDTATINFATPLDPSAPGFNAQMIIGDGFSYDGFQCTQAGQTSNITVNSTLITNSAGCNDSSIDASPANGNLITVGNMNSAYSPLLPTVAQDHEHYNITPEITTGDTAITVATLNPSHDDNIFLEVFQVTGIAGFNQPPPTTSVPEPATLSLFGAALLGLGLLRRRRQAS